MLCTKNELTLDIVMQSIWCAYWGLAAACSGAHPPL
jgi:hypothetical protein